MEGDYHTSEKVSKNKLGKELGNNLDWRQGCIAIGFPNQKAEREFRISYLKKQGNFK